MKNKMSKKQKGEEKEKEKKEKKQTKKFPLLKPILELASSRERNFTPNGEQTLT